VTVAGEYVDLEYERYHKRVTASNDSRAIDVFYREYYWSVYLLWSAKIRFSGFQRNVTLLHSDRLPSEALCCGKIPSYFEALTDPRDKPIRLTFI
jgi:hypothetical protein